MLKIRRSHDRLIFRMGIPIPGKDSLYIETGSSAWLSTQIAEWWAPWTWRIHDDIIKLKDFLCYWPFVWGIHRSPVNSPHKGQWRGALMFALICSWINGSINNREASYLRCHCTHYDVTVMYNIGVWFLRVYYVHLMQRWKFISHTITLFCTKLSDKHDSIVPYCNASCSLLKYIPWLEMSPRSKHSVIDGLP